MTGRILVTGAGGNVGRPLTAALAAAGAPVLAATRSGTDVAGAVGRRLDFLDPATWPTAFRDVATLFLIRPPAIGNVRRDLLPAVEAATAVGVGRIVFLSLQGVERTPFLPHAAAEKWIRHSGVSWTFLRASYFCQNLSTVHAADIRDHDRIIVPAGGGATAFVDAVDVADMAADAILHPAAHEGRAWTVTGPRALTYRQVADILTGELGRPIRYRSPSIPAYARHARRRLRMPWGMVAVTTAIYTTARLGMAAGLSTDVADVLRRPPTDVTEFARRERAAWIPRSTP